MFHHADRAGDAPRLAPLIGDREIAWDASAASVATSVAPISTELLDELQRNRALLRPAVPAEGAAVDNAAFPVLRREAMRVLQTWLDGAPGFVVLRGLDPSVFSAAEAQNVFWRFCNVLGEPLAQKGEGVKFGRVADLGLPAEARPRYHETGVGGSIHTDSPIMPQVADLVGLLCVRAALEGGDSKFVSVARVHDILLRHAESLLAELYAPFYFDRRIKPAAVSSANPAFLRAPIFTYDPDLGARGLRLRWQPEYVWQAPELPGVPPLSERRRLALHLLEGVLEDRAGAITVRLSMRPGDMQFLNNHAVAHGRTPFFDHPHGQDSSRPDPPPRREMRRVWLRRRP
jgi:alpha-ketoglutarate-dependent taurine dioxygenase